MKFRFGGEFLFCAVGMDEKEDEKEEAKEKEEEKLGVVT